MYNLPMEELKELFANVLNISVTQINQETSPLNTPNWDSLKFMQLVTAFENVFQVKLSIEQIMKLKDFKSFENLLTEL
jgi:acyl carrier protein